MMSGSYSVPARKPWRWLLVIAAAALLVGILPTLLLAQWGPYALGRALSAYLQTSVTVQGVRGGWWSGLTVHQLSVAEDPTPQAATLVRVEHLTVNLPVVSLLFSSKPLTLHLDDVRIDLRRRQDGQWNLTPLLKVLGTGASARPHARAIVPQLNRQVAVTVTHGKLRLGEEAEFTDLGIGLHLTKGELTITQAEANIAGGIVALQGEVSLQDPTPNMALHLRLAGTRLDRLLGPAFRHITIAEATGRLTQEGDGFVLETAVHVPTFTLSPGTLGGRQPHLTHVALTCTLRLLPPFARLAMDACRLHAAEAQLSLRGSALDLGTEPRLTLQVDGSLAGSLVGALVPEVPGEFPEPVNVHGQITVPLRGAVWHAMGWRLAVTSERFVFDDTFTEVHTTVVKSVDRLEVANLHARRGTGRIHGAGAWRLAEPVGGDLQVEMDRISLRQTLAQGAAEGPYLVEGTLSGTVAWRMDAHGERFTLDGHVQPLHLRHAATTIVQVPEGRVQGELGRDGDGSWRGDQLVFRSDDLAVELRDVAARRTPTYYDLSMALDLQASAEVITGLTGGLLPDRLQVSGPIELAGSAAGHIAVGGGASLRDLTFTGDLRLARVAWGGASWEAVAAHFTVAQGRLTIDDARARVLGGWMRLRPDTFVDLQGPRRDFQVHLTADQLDLRFETGKRVPLLALLIPLFLLEPDRQDPIRMSGMLDAEVHASGTYDGQPGWEQSVNGHGYFRIAQGAVLGSTAISGFVTKALALPANVVDQSVKALLEGTGKPLQVLKDLLRRAFVFGTLSSPIELRAGKIHLADDLTVHAPEFSLVIRGYSTIEGVVDYDVHSDLIHRLLFGEVIDLTEEIPVLGTVLRHVNPFQLIHRHIELSATVQGNMFRLDAAGQPDVHVGVYVVQ
jgi:AsmA-like C-terminal region